MIEVTVIWFPFRPGKAEQAAEVVPSSVSFSKPLKRSGRVEQVMVDDLGPGPGWFTRNSRSSFRGCR